MGPPFKPFAAPAGVPVLGQYECLSWAPVVVLKCSCATHDVLHVVGFQATVCPSCYTVYRMSHVEWDAATGLKRLAFNIGSARPLQADAAKGG